jgi:hypothetical protein
VASTASEFDIGDGRPALIIHSFRFPRQVRGALFRHHPLISFPLPGSRSFVPTLPTYFLFPARFEELCSDIIHSFPFPCQVRGALFRHHPLISFPLPGSRSFVPTSSTHFLSPARFKVLCSDITHLFPFPRQDSRSFVPTLPTHFLFPARFEEHCSDIMITHSFRFPRQVRAAISSTHLVFPWPGSRSNIIHSSLFSWPGSSSNLIHSSRFPLARFEKQYHPLISFSPGQVRGALFRPAGAHQDAGPDRPGRRQAVLQRHPGGGARGGQVRIRPRWLVCFLSAIQPHGLAFFVVGFFPPRMGLKIFSLNKVGGRTQWFYLSDTLT